MLHVVLRSDGTGNAASKAVAHVVERLRADIGCERIAGFTTVQVFGQAHAGGGVVGFDTMTYDVVPVQTPLARLSVQERGLEHIGGDIGSSGVAPLRKIGRFAVDVAAFEDAALAPLKALVAAPPVEANTLVIVNELGPMQTLCAALAPTVGALMASSNCIVLCAVRQASGGASPSTLPWAALAARSDVEIVDVTRANADSVGPRLFGHFAPLLTARGGGGAGAPASAGAEERRRCAACKTEQPRACFSRSQWDKAGRTKGPKKGKCAKGVGAAEAAEAAAVAAKRGGASAARSAARSGASARHVRAADALREAAAATAAEAEATTGLRAARGRQIKRGGARWRGRGRGRGRR